MIWSASARLIPAISAAAPPRASSASIELCSQHSKATVVREAAQDRLRVLLAQAEIVRSLGASVRTVYDMAGVSG